MPPDGLTVAGWAPMPRRFLLRCFAAALVAILAGCSSGNPEAVRPASSGTTTTSSPTTTTATPSTTSSTTSSSTTTTLAPEVVAIDALLDAMADRDLAQQLVVFGASGPAPAVSIGDALGDVCVGGVFVTKNVGNWQPAGSLDAATEAIGVISEAGAACAVPPFITTDAEPGTRVLKVPVEPLPDPATLAAGFAENPDTSGLLADTERFATELAAAGVHVNLGVVADIDVADGFYMDREGRSLGSDPVAVDLLTRSLVDGHCLAGVAATLKHFPNQGSTVEDPHREDSFSIHGFETWLGLGAAPYLDTSAPLVMTGHIRYIDVDGGLPASLSREITNGWLRDELGYDGVVITDDLHTMRGVAQFAPAERGVTAIAAGADLALYVATDDATAVVDAIVERMQTDADFALQARASARRVVELKARLGLVSSIDPTWFNDSVCPPVVDE